MIAHLRHDEIDRAWWDAQLMRCSNRLWYAQSWVLDAACPGWQALTDGSTGAIMPLTARRKWGIDYLYQPYGLQQLGVFAPVPSTQIVTDFLAAIPHRFRYVDICINQAAATAFGSDRLIERHDHVLSLDKDARALQGGYSEGHRRNIRKASEASMEPIDLSPEDFVRLFEHTTAARFGGLRSVDKNAMLEVLRGATRRGQCVISSCQQGGATTAAQCFVRWEGRLILFKSAVTEDGMKSRALFRLVDDVIVANANSGVLLDFAGTDTPSVARFYAGFGARASVYLRLVRNRLPPPLRWLKR